MGTTTPNASAALDINSTTAGLLPPRMTSAQRDAISSPTAGLTIFNTSVNLLQVFDGATWGNASGSSTQESVQGSSVSLPVGGTWTNVLSLTVTTGGKYLVLSNGNTGAMNPWTYFSSNCQLIKNGTSIDYKYFYYGSGSGGSGPGVPHIHYSLQTLTAGDIIKVQCLVTTNGPSASASDWKISLLSLGISNISGADNLGSHTATQNLNLSSYQLVGNGGSTGIAISSTGSVGIGTTSPSERLDLGGGNLKAGYEIVNNSCNANIYCSATCPSGKYVISGGCMINDSANGSNGLLRSFPSTSSTWQCTANSTPSSYMSAYAICLNIR